MTAPFECRPGGWLLAAGLIAALATGRAAQPPAGADAAAPGRWDKEGTAGGGQGRRANAEAPRRPQEGRGEVEDQGRASPPPGGPAREEGGRQDATAVPAKSRTQLAELKRHLSALDKSESAPGSAAAPPEAATASWGTDVAAIGKIITEMVGGETTGAATASTPGATGTSGSKAAEAVALDDETRSEVDGSPRPHHRLCRGQGWRDHAKGPGRFKSPERRRQLPA